MVERVKTECHIEDMFANHVGQTLIKLDSGTAAQKGVAKQIRDAID
jgi:hypothetical protein